MNYIKWSQIGSSSFVSEGENFSITPLGCGSWRLYSKQKGKGYVFLSLEEAFEGARNIANFYRMTESVPSYLITGRYAIKGK